MTVALPRDAVPTNSDLVRPPQSSVDERGHDVSTRIEVAREALIRADAAAGLFRMRHNFAWLTAGGVNHVVLADEKGAAPLLVTPSEVVVLAPVNEAARLRDEELAGLPIEVAELPWHDPAAVEAEARRRSGGRLAGDDELEEALRPARSMLSPIEERRLAWLGERARSAVEGTLAGANPGDTEDALAGALLARLTVDGIRAPVFLAGADERIARYRHPLPSGRAVRGRVMLVLVAERWGLHAALTRFRDFEPPDPETARRVAAVADVLGAAEAATRLGNTLGDAFEAARLAYARTGFPDEWRLHHQGGSIGYRTRERIAVPNDPTPIVAGMAFAWNPSITGAKAEETGFLAPGGAYRRVTAASGPA